MNGLIDDFKNRISSYDKEYEFSQEEVLNILERYEIKYGNVKAIPLDKVRQAREEMLKQFVDLQDGSEEWRSYVNEAVLECVEILDKLIAESEG